MIKRGSKAQTQLSFGMIFSIIMIIVFLVFAFYGIKTFLGIQDSAKIGSFIKDFQKDIDEVWKSQESSQQEEYFLPSKISMVCFADFSVSKSGQKAFVYDEIKKTYQGNENMFFYPVKYTGLESSEIKNIDVGEIVSGENPFCLETENGKLKLKITKDFSDRKVKIERQNVQ